MGEDIEQYAQAMTPDEVESTRPHFEIDTYDPLASAYVDAALLCRRTEMDRDGGGLTLVGATSRMEFYGPSSADDELFWLFVSVHGIRGQDPTNSVQIGIIRIDTDTGEPLDSNVIAFTQIGSDGGGVGMAVPIVSDQVGEYGTYHLSVFIDGKEASRATVTRTPVDAEGHPVQSP